jgi:dTDP-4-dehydrorhamnose 3,5-epimerase
MSGGVVDTARFVSSELPLAGAWHVQRKPIKDSRGFFTRVFCLDELSGLGWSVAPAQINHSFTSTPGTVRGLHFQHAPHAEHKLVSCIAGRIFDVLLDLRRGSPTFLQWCGVELSASAQDSVSIPPGVAHGFQTLEADTQLLYVHSVAHAPGFEGGVNVRDPRLGPTPLGFPLSIVEMSARDQQFPLLSADFEGLSS